MINTLTDTKCKQAKPADKPYKMFDGHGLYLHVSVAGGKHWHMAYRVGGKPQTKSLGAYPLVSLAAARSKRDELRAKLHAGESLKKPHLKTTMTVRQVCEEYWQSRKDVSPKYRENALNAMQRHVYPRLGGLPMPEVDRALVMDALLVMDAGGLYNYVRKVRMWLSGAFDWAVEHTDRTGATVNPCTQINPRKAFGREKVQSFASLELTRIPDFMKRLELEWLIQSAQACRLMALTAVRTKELRLMRWTDIDGDLLRIPKDRMKKELDLLVPLSRQAMEIIDNLRARSNSDYLFPNARRLDRPMSENAVLYLIGRMGYGKEMTGHGWRTAMSTWANEAGFNADAIERQLAHVPGDKIRGIYNRAEYLPERRRMLQAWADWLIP